MRSVESKIKTLEELKPILRKARVEGQKVVLGHGIFDFLHYGHIYYLKQARNLGDILVVSVVNDKFVEKGPNRPMFNEKVRTHFLASLEYVDYVVLCNDFGPWGVLKEIKPDIFAKGEDSKPQLKNPSSGLNKDKKIVESYGGVVHFTHSLPIHSTELLKKHFGFFSPEAEAFLNSFKKNYFVSDVLAKIETLKKMKVLVVGEAIIDEYRYVASLGKPPKANIIATHYLNKEEFAGGVLACANHVAGVCGKVTLVTYLGEKNSREEFVRRHLKDNVKPVFFYCPGQPTIVKRRFVDPAYYTKIFEEYEFDKNFLPLNLETELSSYLAKEIPKHDLVIVTDYGHGFLSERLIDVVSKKAKFLAVNAQTNSGNAGFNYITKYPKVDYACIDEIEARLAAHDNFNSIEDIVLALFKKMKIKKMVITMGHRGSLAYEKNQGFKTVPPFATKITDTIGAGDAFLAISAPCAAAGFPMELTSFMGNVAGSIAVGILGNKSAVEKSELLKHISYLLD